MNNIKQTIWSTLSNTAGSILEHVDINRDNIQLKLDEEFDNGYHKGVVNKKVIDDILMYQETHEGKGYYKAEFDGNILSIQFLKRAL